MGSQKPIRVETITYVRRKGFHVTLTTAASPALVLQIAALPPNSMMTPLEMWIAYGPQEDTNEEQLELYLAMVDISNLPTAASLREMAIWQDSQKWQNQGTPANTIQVMKSANPVWTRPQTWASVTVNDRLRASGLSILSFASGSLDIKVHGVLTWEVTLLQRVWRDDNANDGLMMEEWPEFMEA